MAKNWKLQDIKPPERKRRRTSSRPTETEAERPREDAQSSEPYEEHTSGIDSIEVIDGRGKRLKKAVISTLIIVIVIGAGYAVTSLLRGADVTVYPKYKDVNIDATFTSNLSPSSGELGHEILTLEEVGERTVTADGQEEVSERARGTITIYNAYSTESQRLIKNTRFASPEGLIFRIPDSVDVPGYTEDESGDLVPGQINVEVFADAPGEQYNIDPVRFSIPGLEGTDQYETMYALSNEAFSGGFEGQRFVLNEDELAIAQQELHIELRDKLLERLPNERPAGFELFEGAITFDYESLPFSETEGDSALIQERARLIVPLFEDAEFATYIAENTIAGYESLPVRIEDSSQIAFSYPTTTGGDISDDESIRFDLTGDVRVIWTFDKEQLREDLNGLQKTALPSVLSGYPSIERAESVIRPFFKQSFPEDTSEIDIIEVVGENR